MLCTSLNAQVDFNRQVRPVRAEHCLQCHGPDAGKRSAELRLDAEAEAKKSAIVFGAAADSELMYRIQSTDPETNMPPPATGRVLTAAPKEILRQWIQEGAKYSNRWAFQPIADFELLLNSLPASEADAMPIDRLVMDKLQKAGLRYSNPVNRTQFIRRATFDLSGLPPTWTEVEAFESDIARRSEERLIDGRMTSAGGVGGHYRSEDQHVAGPPRSDTPTRHRFDSPRRRRSVTWRSHVEYV